MSVLMMYSRKELACVLLVSVAFTLPVMAQAPTKIYLSAGTSFAADPVGLREHHDPGVNVGIGIGLPLSHALEVVFAVHYNQFRQNGVGITSWSRVEKGHDHISSATAGLKYSFAPQKRIRPYISLNGGLYHWVNERLRYATFGKSVSQDGFNRIAFGLDLGAGVSMQISSILRVYVEPRYTFAFFSALDDDRLVQYAPVRLGIELWR